MRVPVSWLQDFVDITLPLEELAEKLTFAGLEVEDIEYIGTSPSPVGRGVRGEGLTWDRDKIFVAQLVETLPHPNADRLKIVRVDYGRGEPAQMVTGAPNINVGDKGQKVVLALEGARLYDGHKDGRVIMTLKKSKIRGVESSSMVCSEKELGISEEHEGIIILPDDAPVGTPLADYLGDVVFDIKINPNFARAQSVLGVAREIAALTGQKVRLPQNWNTQEIGAPQTDFVAIEIADPKLCARFSALLIRHVTIKPSPYWMQQRLLRAGMRPINNVVDITNYVMLGYGKPLHAFDYDALVKRAQRAGNHGVPKIIVRPAREGETMQTLDGQMRTFHAHDLLVTDAQGPVGIAGIMGGSETEVSDATKNVLLETAIFDFISIRRTTAEQKLPSEAATRFGRGIPASQNVAPARVAAELMRDLAGGTIAPALADNYPVPQQTVTVNVTRRDVKRILGIDLSLAEMERILRALDFQVTQHGADALRVTPPDYRTDVDGADDVLEEIVRIYGYDKIPSTLIADALPPLEGNVALEQEEAARDLLVEAGLQEIVTYSFTHPAREANLTPDASPTPLPAGEGEGGGDFPLPQREYVAIENPISPERSVLRQTLLPNMLDSAASNLRAASLRGKTRVALFEIGAVFLKRRAGETQPGDLPEDANLPLEPRRLALVLTGPRAVPTWQDADTSPMDFYDLKGIVEDLGVGLHVGNLKFVATAHPMLHPGRAARLYVDEEFVGVLGELHPLVREKWEFPPQAVLVGEFDLDKLLAHTNSRFIVTPISRYPAVVQDIALLVDETAQAARIEALIRQTGGALLRDVRLFDVYRGAPLPAGKKSLAYTLVFQALDHVLSDTDAGKLRDKIVGRLKREVGAELRSS
jgi:phenylalanyl-tRNA synthetase beta chain